MPCSGMVMFPAGVRSEKLAVRSWQWEGDTLNKKKRGDLSCLFFLFGNNQVVVVFDEDSWLVT